MKTFRLFSSLVLFSIILNSCTKEKDIDTEKPTIDLSIENAFPLNCDTLYFGEPFDFVIHFADNAELGSYNINIHNNFDHHTHSTEISMCDEDKVKEAVNPLTSVQDYEIPEGSKEYTTSVTINIPSELNGSVIDEGDYHFFISLTDKEGWSTQKGLSIKIMYRQ